MPGYKFVNGHSPVDCPIIYKDTACRTRVFSELADQLCGDVTYGSYKDSDGNDLMRVVYRDVELCKEEHDTYTSFPGEETRFCTFQYPT